MIATFFLIFFDTFACNDVIIYCSMHSLLLHGASFVTFIIMLCSIYSTEAGKQGYEVLY